MSIAGGQAVQDRLAQLLADNRGYEFLMQAEAHLAAHPEDHRVRLLAVREYLKLGLVVPARELGLEVPAGVVLPPEFEAVRQTLRTMAGRATARAELADRFERNLAALAQRGAPAALIRQAWREHGANYELFQDRAGCEQVRWRDKGRRRRWVPLLADHGRLAEARSRPEEKDPRWPGPYLFEGIELGHFFERLYHATARTFLNYSCALYVLEPEPAALAVTLHLRDWAGLLADPRVFIFVGPECLRELLRLLDGNRNLPWPRHVLHLNGMRGGRTIHAAAVVQEAWNRRQAATELSLRQLEERYAGRDVRHWADRLAEALSGRGQPLRILGAVSRHTTFLKHSLRDAQRALESLGHTCVVLTEQTDYEIVDPLTHHAAIRESDPDVYLVLDHLRPEFPGILPANLPLLTWDQDQLPHVCTPQNMRGVAWHDFIVGYSKGAFVRAGCNPRQYLNVRIPTSPEQFSGPPLTPAEQERYACDVSYVSHASQTARQFHDEERARVSGNPALVRLLDTLHELFPPRLAKHREIGGQIPYAVLREALDRCGVTLTDEGLRGRLISWYLWRLGDRLFRHEALEWVAAWARAGGHTLRLYGNGWDRHPTLAEFAAGPAENGRELLCIYRASRINLQLMPAGFIHQRSLDGLAAGGFFLTRQAEPTLRAPRLRALLARIAELNIRTTRELLTHPDEQLGGHLRAFCGEWLDQLDPADPAILTDLQIAGECEYAGGVSALPRDHFRWSGGLCSSGESVSDGGAAAPGAYRADAAGGPGALHVPGGHGTVSAGDVRLPA